MALAFLIRGDSLQLLGERRVLKEAEYAALLEADDVVAVAHAEAARIVAHARERAADDRSEARRHGEDEGRAAFAARLLDGAAQQRREVAGLREAMARLVARGVAQLVGDADPALVFERALARVDALVRDEPFVNVRVAPSSEAALRRALEALHERHGSSLQAAVQADPSLADGACVMQTASGTLELGLDAQLAALERAIRGEGAA